MMNLITLIVVAVICIQVRAYNNPILLDKAYYDPGVLKVNDTYYMVAYTDITEGIFPIHTSTDLVQWDSAGYAFDETNRPTWADKTSLISPDIYQVGTNFLLYFAAYNTTSYFWHIGVASAPHPLGPYSSIDRPIVSRPDGHSYTPSIIKSEDNLYLVWSNYSQTINARQLSGNGFSFSSEETTIVLKPTLTWEQGNVYFPWHIQRGSYHYLLYTAGDCVGIGVARSAHALGPYEKLPQPIITPNGDYLCTRDAAVVKDVDDENDVILFNSEVRGTYTVVLSSLSWDADDWPYIEES